GLTGRETFHILGLSGELKPRQELTVVVTADDPSARFASGQAGRRTEFTAIARLDTPIDVDYYRNGGILQTVLRGLMKDG
ncbi:MAG: hypothetical protein HZB20_05390, partial [Chloroflexi bacterium]|nr:hypothetical protein [Chloroflexota bacterium]